MRIEPMRVDGIRLIRWDPVRDVRGSFARTFCRAGLEAAGLRFEVEQVSLSRNDRTRTLRGMHYQRPPHAEAKIVLCTRGRLWDVAVDMRRGGSSYRQWLGVELAADRPAGLYVPAGFAHGFLTLEPDTEILYLIDGRFVPEAATGFRWDDPAIGIEWPETPHVMLPRDREYPLLGRDEE